jgi:hypothetical protein
VARRQGTVMHEVCSKCDVFLGKKIEIKIEEKKIIKPRLF